MKKNATILLLLVTTLCLARQVASKGIVSIIDVRKAGEQEPDPAKHKQHDVVVCRTEYRAYTVYFFRTERDTVQRFQATWGSDDDLNKASYKWLDDTLVSIKLYSTTSKKQAAFKVFGRHLPDGSKRTGITRND